MALPLMPLADRRVGSRWVVSKPFSRSTRAAYVLSVLGRCTLAESLETRWQMASVVPLLHLKP